MNTSNFSEVGQILSSNGISTKIRTTPKTLSIVSDEHPRMIRGDEHGEDSENYVRTEDVGDA